MIFLLISQSSAVETIINGEILGENTLKKITLENLVSKEITAESKINKDGTFQIKIDIDISNFYKLTLNQNIYVIYIPKPGEIANIKIDIKSPENHIISGSEHTNLYYKTQNNIKKSSEEEQKNIVKELIEKNPNSLVCLIFVNKLDFDKDAAYIKMVIKGLSKYSENKFVIGLQEQWEQHKKFKNQHKKLELGMPAPEISLNDPTGKIIKLSSLKGNYVLIDFWASWCRPCRMESPTLVKIFKKYHSKGFEIYSVSLDKSGENWKKAIKDDKLEKWTHVSDLKSWNSEGGKTYNVKSIPYTVLIDREGKIIAKNLRGDGLKKKLEEIFDK